MCICKGCHVLEKVRAVDNAKFETTNEGSPTGTNVKRDKQPQFHVPWRTSVIAGNVYRFLIPAIAGNSKLNP